MNNYYTPATPSVFIPNTKARSDDIVRELEALESAFDLLPASTSALVRGVATFCGSTAGTANQKTLSRPNPQTSVLEGDHIAFIADAANTGPVTLTVDAIGPVPLVRADGSALAANDLLAGVIFSARFDNTNNRWQLLNPSPSYLVNAQASADAAAASELAAGISETNAATSESNAAASELAASVSADGAQAWAIRAEDDPVPPLYGGDGATTFSAFHWAQKASQASGLPLSPTTGDLLYFNGVAWAASTGLQWNETSDVLTSSGGILLDGGGRGLAGATGGLGTVRTVGTGQGGFDGYTIGGRVGFVHDGANQAGLYDDVNDVWLVLSTLAGATALYHAGVAAARTIAPTDGGLEVNNTLTGAGWERVLTGVDLFPLTLTETAVRAENNTGGDMNIQAVADDALGTAARLELLKNTAQSNGLVISYARDSDTAFFGSNTNDVFTQAFRFAQGSSTVELPGVIAFDNAFRTNDHVQLYGQGAAGGYGIGAESGFTYARAPNGFRWYINSLADGVSQVMRIDQAITSVNADIRVFASVARPTTIMRLQRETGGVSILDVCSTLAPTTTGGRLRWDGINFFLQTVLNDVTANVAYCLPTEGAVLRIPGVLRFDNVIRTDGSVQLWAGDQSDGYAIGIESNTQYFRAFSTFRWYLQTFAGNANEAYMELDRPIVPSTGITYLGIGSPLLGFGGGIRFRGTSGTYGLRSPLSSAFGNVSTDGAGGASGWEGYSINDRVAFMHDNSNSAGIYNVFNTRWMMFCALNGAVTLYNAGSEAVRSTSNALGGAQVNTSFRGQTLPNWKRVLSTDDIAQHVTDSGGGPYLNGTTLNTSGTLTNNTWTSIGPTGSGATVIWTALDSLPEGVQWIRVRIYSYGLEANLNLKQLALYARRGGSAVGVLISTQIAWLRVQNSQEGGSMCEATIPIGTIIGQVKRFELYRSQLGFATSSDQILMLVGYGWNS
jgi:hypothetical protein